ncbi:MAG: metallophosphoesterase [Candidatus Gracilibacteria bacterium]|nr:metallophosphoesterase [Candidatus Gracilibacteria bacterium]
MISLLFIGVLALYIALNYLFLSSVFKIFSYRNKKKFTYLLVFFILLPLVSMFLHRFAGDRVGKWIYLLGISYVGVIIISSYVFVFYRIIHLKYKKKYIGYTSLALVILLLSYSLYCGRSIVVKEIDIKTQKIQESKKIVYMADIHIDTLNDEKYIEKIVKMTNEINPDMVLINGDLVDGTSLTHATFSGFDQIKAPIYATLGNHEIYMGIPYVEEILAKTKIKLLRDEMIEEQGIQILGADEIGARSKDADTSKLQKFLANNKIDSTKPAILMLHEPVGMDIAEKSGIDLQVAGHTHDGQIWPFSYLVKQVFGYNYGLYNIGNMKFYITSGTGLWGPPFRLGTRNEIVVINIGK